MTQALYPLQFEPIYKDKVWGGRTLEKLGRTLPPGDIGESWELVDLATTSASGGGGSAEHSIIANGPWRGRTFHDVIQTEGKRLLGDLPLNEFGEFPLLVKFLDAHDNLSVQVHPSAKYAAVHDDAFLKSEAWYVLHCEPGPGKGCIYKGIVEGVTPEQFRAAIERDEVKPLMVKIEVAPGDCHYLPSGTCHALGAGVLVAEVQTPSDTTFRVYDWGRKGRQLHVEEALQCIDFAPPLKPQASSLTPPHLPGPYATIDRLVDCEYFRIDRVAVKTGAQEDLPHHQPRVWMVLSGDGTITGNFGDAVALKKGQTIYLPPQLDRAQLEAASDMVWLEVSFPQAEPGSIA